MVTGTIRASALLRTILVLSLLLLLCLSLCFAEGVPQRLRALGREMRKRPSAAADGTDGAGKRHATGEGSKKDLSSPLSPTVLEPGYVKQLKSDFEQTANKPYSHCVLKNFCDKDRLRAVHDELVNNLSANLKESDLFKVYQTCDLANLGRNGVLMDLAAKMPNLIALRDSLYSEDFKNMIKEVTGCGELNDNVDCATNLHTTGCHLLCHDDVIGTRKVSYIIYLTSPDEEWTREVPARSDRLDRRASRPRVRPTQTGARRLKLALPKVDFGKCRAAAGWRGAGAVPVHHPGCCVPPPSY